jgi:NADH-quinone oxidoreductase subunit C
MSSETITPPGMGMPADDAAPDPFGRGPAGMQREEVDAAHRGTAPSTTVDHRGLAIATETAAALVEALGEGAEGWSLWRDEVTVTVTPGALVRAASWLRDDAGYALLSDVSPCDRLGSERAEFPKRFCVDYIVTKLVAGAPRVRLRVWVDEGETIESLIPVYPTADWHEREAFDFFGIEFTGREGLRRLIMPDDWVGHPLRKDYPIGGEPVTFTNAAREL